MDEYKTVCWETNDWAPKHDFLFATLSAVKVEIYMPDVYIMNFQKWK